MLDFVGLKAEKTPFSRKKLSKIQLKDFEKTLESEATWHLDKEAIAIYHMQCEKKQRIEMLYVINVKN